MQFGFGKRNLSAQTTLPCPQCNAPLLIERSCRSANMRCPACGRVFAVEAFIAKADEAMEVFLDGVYIDRI